ncbi:FAD-binding domain-containing protein [Stereum hirsutum FP-91666 SS1]|uniref:FAD-binding domain-containing protein n=1 Tax=Stereum hirsutum (strain FP-91666) TaxID=721885 RepID=R7RXH4_STEHR|nr:FAD-binding domain-containing protein [Stereum hirsutum FP-91666 SS1]EIM79523.1 FAD-binding domain-containing protein [Stereum hirsutum FP-91666 SS1]
MGSSRFGRLTFLFIYLVDISVEQSSTQWNALNATVQGRLIRGVPFARPCFQLTNQTSGTFDADKCSIVIQDYLNESVRVDTFSAYMNTQWETCQTRMSQCLLDASIPSNPDAFDIPHVCSQGSIPEYGIDVRTAENVLAGYNFSKAHSMPLVIKNTGHDYKGRSSAPNSLALWVHNLQSISLNKSFVPNGCNSTEEAEAVTFGAGVLASTAVDFAEANNITIPTGADPTVGVAGGYLQGGGHSALSNTLGLAVDRVLQFEVVTPSGLHVLANKCQHADLFFALRGGGGGTFGTVLSVTTLALPQMHVNAVQVSFDPVRENQKRFVEFIVKHTVQFAQDGWGGYIAPITGSIILANSVLNSSEALDSIDSLRSFIVEKLNGNFTFVVEPSYKSFLDKFEPAQPVGTEFTLSSRLIPLTNFQSDASREELASVINGMLDTVPFMYLAATTPFLYGDNPGTSVTSAWRTSLWHFVIAAEWNFNSTVADVSATYKSLSDAVRPLREITVGSGAYPNEADLYEPDFQVSFWGSNYEELLAIKKKYDPDHLLDCWQCVGWAKASSPIFDCYLPL